MDKERTREIFWQIFNISDPHNTTIAARNKVTETILLNVLSETPIEEERLKLILTNSKWQFKN